MATHPYDGTPNDGFCECGQPSSDPVHPPSTFPPVTRDPEAWKEAWERSRRLQRAMREQGQSRYYVSARAEYDYCKAVQDCPSGHGPSAEDWFRDDEKAG